MIVRIFQSVPHERTRDEWHSFLLAAREKLATADGLVDQYVGEDLDRPGGFVFVTVWRDESSMEETFGAGWRQATITEDEAKLVSNVSVQHIRLIGS